MAGNYPDVPAPRMAYDRDGTQVLHVNFSVASSTALAASTIQSLNGESNTGYQVATDDSTSRAIVFIFPQLRDISAYMVRLQETPATVGALERSTNTTNGIDGTWTSVVSPWSSQTTTSNLVLRNNITTQSILGVKALRFRGNTSSDSNREFRIFNIHLYGGIASGETVDRLRMWHPTLDEPLDDLNAADGAYLDWAEVTRGTTADRTFRIKNNSSSLTANSISVATQASTDANPALGPQFTYSDGGSFATSITITSLPPGAISNVITVRRTTPTNATLALWWLRTVAEAGSWT